MPRLGSIHISKGNRGAYGHSVTKSWFLSAAMRTPASVSLANDVAKDAALFIGKIPPGAFQFLHHLFGQDGQRFG